MWGSTPVGGQMTPFDSASLSLNGSLLLPTVGMSVPGSDGHVAPGCPGSPRTCAAATSAADRLDKSVSATKVMRTGLFLGHIFPWIQRPNQRSRSRPLVPPISSSYSGCGQFVKELEIEKRH